MGTKHSFMQQVGRLLNICSTKLTDVKKMNPHMSCKELSTASTAVDPGFVLIGVEEMLQFHEWIDFHCGRLGENDPEIENSR